MAPKQIIVKRYRDEREYQRDAQKMARKQYKIISVISEKPRAGIMRFLTLGIFTLIFPPKSVYIVTYSL